MKTKKGYKAQFPIREDYCPRCNSNNLDYGDIDWHGDTYCQHIDCRDCDFDFQEWYTTKFDGMTTHDIGSCSHIDII